MRPFSAKGGDPPKDGFERPTKQIGLPATIRRKGVAGPSKNNGQHLINRFVLRANVEIRDSC